MKLFRNSINADKVTIIILFIAVTISLSSTSFAGNKIGYVGDKDCKAAYSAYNEYSDNYTYFDDLCNACREGIWQLSLNMFEFDRACYERSANKTNKIPYEMFKKKVCYRDDKSYFLEKYFKKDFKIRETGMSPTYNGPAKPYVTYIDYTVGSHPQYVLEVEKQSKQDEFTATKKGRSSGILVHYHFKKMKGKWALINKKDESD
jgi:hypothetical protein